MSNKHWTLDNRFEIYVQAFNGNRYAAINYVAKLGRKRRDSVDGCITEAQALSWVITGVEPPYIKKYLATQKQRREMAQNYVEDRLLYIDDLEVRDAVRSSIQQSKHSNHLIYCYNNTNNEGQRARVRVLCNIIWDELRQLDVEDRV